MRRTETKPGFITVDEAAEYLGVSRATIYRMANEGSVRLYRTGRRRTGIKRKELIAVRHAKPERVKQRAKKPEKRPTWKQILALLGKIPQEDIDIVQRAVDEWREESIEPFA